MDLPLLTLKLMCFSQHCFHFNFPTLISLLPSFLTLLYPVLIRRSPFSLTESYIHTTPTPLNSYCLNMTSLTAILFFPLICALASLLDTCPPFPRLLLCPTTPPSFLILTLLLRKVSCSLLCYVRHLYSPLLYFLLTFCRITFHMLRDGSSSGNFHIPWNKITKELGAFVILTARNDILCPVTALKNHLSINSSMNQSTSLFAYATTSSQSKILLKHEFLNFCNHIWSSTMLAHVLGHSFHIGGTVELLLADGPPEIVAATGGWTSLAFLLNWCHMEEILPMSTSKAYNKSHIDSLAAIFEQFRIKNKIPSALIIASDGNLTL